MTGRLTWEAYFLGIAQHVATRATCPRKHVGAVIATKTHRALTTGYNGSVRGTVHCEDAGCLIENGHCVRTVHAEVNALLQAARYGIAVDGATIYTTASPCKQCFKLIANAGITRVVYHEQYGENTWLVAPGIEVVHAKGAVIPAIIEGI